MGLTYPRDLDAWQRWQDSRNRVRRARARLVRRPDPTLVLTCGGPHPDVLVALDSLTASSRAAVGVLAGHVPTERVAVLAPTGVDPGFPVDRSFPVSTADEGLEAVPHLRAVVSLGHHLPAGRMGHDIAQRSSARHFVVQHGLLTPMTPPLAEDSTLLAWTEPDGDYWRSGRTDITVDVVGSQLLWDAAEAGAVPDGSDAPLTFLGQLHGAEVGRAQMARVAVGFCRAHHAVYRPHPAEVDRLSRLQHRAWQHRGIVIDASGRPLASLDGGVVGVFSTGVLEAAARGLPAWVHHPDPPPWVAELWERYGLAPFGGDPTAPPERATTEPAVRVAEAVCSTRDGAR